MRLINLPNIISLLRSTKPRKIHVKNGSQVENHKSLQYLVIQRIKATGPITIAQFMKDVLVNPAYGYYTTRDMFGRYGDFVTSPEISHMFGEMVAVWFTSEWHKVGSPKPLHLIELGPGRGSMMSDMLRTFTHLKLNDHLTVHMVEVSDVLAKIQSEKLCAFAENHDSESNYYRSGKTKTGINIRWYKCVEDIRIKEFAFVIAHEFFDALPIHKFQRTDRGWCEVLVDIESDDKLKFVLSPGPTALSKVLISDSERRDHVEISPDSILIMEHLANQLERYGGIALIIDYGHCGTKTDTFRAFRNHRQCDPLTNVGSTDLTADVDFAALKKAVGDKLISFGPVTQRQFLQQMKIDVRLQILLKNSTDNQQKDLLQSGYKTLMDEDKMGSAFHFVSFFPAVLKRLLRRYPSVGFLENISKD